MRFGRSGRGCRRIALFFSSRSLVATRVVRFVNLQPVNESPDNTHTHTRSHRLAIDPAFAFRVEINFTTIKCFLQNARTVFLFQIVFV